MGNSENKVKPIIDKRFNQLSYEQFLIDSKTKKFNKMCMTQVMNADMMIATFGEEQYYKTSEEILESGNIAYRQLGIDHLIHVYIHSYKFFMAVANDDISDEAFYKLMRGFYEQYELANAQNTELGGVSRFAVVFGDDLVDRAKSAFYMHRHLQNNFIEVSDEKIRLIEEREKNVAMFELLNYAITNDKVVPFYQGIHKNESGKINKYEALMRIYDQNGNICPPGFFLEYAKKLKMYLSLSKIVIEKALSDFENKKSKLSINISLLDIQSDEFNKWFLKRIKQFSDPSRITLEFVETEDYTNDGELKEFLDNVRKVGCKIAIDDFGVGYATYTSIVSLKPDIIKIDGGIIRNITKNKDNRIILESICYMARLIGSELVAEYVEDEEIQKIILEKEIHFSQGYYFAKPEKFENLPIF